MATNTQDYTGIQKAAILLIALGPERSADIFKHLKEDEIEELTLEIANTRGQRKLSQNLQRPCRYVRLNLYGKQIQASY